MEPNPKETKSPRKKKDKTGEDVKVDADPKSLSASTSHTQFFKREKYYTPHKRVSRDTFYSVRSETDTSESYGCVQHKKRPEKELKEFIEKGNIGDTNAISCPPAYGWEITEKIVFLLEDPVGSLHIERIKEALDKLCNLTRKGFHIKVLDNMCKILDYLIEDNSGVYDVYLKQLLIRIQKPIFLDKIPDIVDYFDNIREYIGYLGYLLIRIDDNELFTILSDGLLWHLSASQKERPESTASLHHTLAAACQVLNHILNRMILFASEYKFPTFLTAAYIIVCHNSENGIAFMKDKIIENILYRFNPYFPEKKIPAYEQTIVDKNYIDVKLGAATQLSLTTFNLMLVLLRTALKAVKDDPSIEFPCPDEESQRCFAWAYRFQCRENELKEKRLTMTVIFTCLLRLYGNKLKMLSRTLMSDILTLSVASEVQCHVPWINMVSMNTYLVDVQFKKALISLSVEFVKCWPENAFLVRNTCWVVGLMYLLDPELCKLRNRWSPTLFAEIRKVALQALCTVLPKVETDLVLEVAIARRILWYIEWYSISPFDLMILYWCIRLLKITLFTNDQPDRKASLRNLFESHGIIIIINLCDTLMTDPLPPNCKCQIILELSIRIITSCLNYKSKCICLVYPELRWPAAITPFAQKMLRDVVFFLTQNYYICDRFLISLLNFIWEGVIWKQPYRERFVEQNGIYKLLDLITMVSPAAQTITLAMICDVLRSGIGIGQIITWRACFGASNATPVLVNRGATIACLLSAVFRDDCKASGIELLDSGILLDNIKNPLMSSSVRSLMSESRTKFGMSKRTLECYTASDIAGSRMSKVFAILHMLSKDLEFKVNIADEAYNLYKNINLTEEDEIILVLCSNYMTFKVFEVWAEVDRMCTESKIVDADVDALEDFLNTGQTWVEHIRRLQCDISDRHHKKDLSKENSLYDFLGRVRLHVALEALREVRRVQRCSDKEHLTVTLIRDAIEAQYRCDVINKKLNTTLYKTYAPLLDEQNITGQHVKVASLQVKKRNIL